jgi:hypothetical protein
MSATLHRTRLEFETLGHAGPANLRSLAEAIGYAATLERAPRSRLETPRSVTPPSSTAIDTPQASGRE